MVRNRNIQSNYVRMASSSENTPRRQRITLPDLALAQLPLDGLYAALELRDHAALLLACSATLQITKSALATTGVAYEYGSLPRGFMKSAPHQGFDPSLYPGPPMIWISKRWVQPGRNPNIAKVWRHAGKHVNLSHALVACRAA